MAVDVSRIPNNNKFDPVREAILELQTSIDETGAAVGNGTLTIDTDSAISGTLTTFTANQSGNASITIGLENTIPGDRTFSGNIVVSGNFTVNGTTTYLNTQQVEVEDNIIELNRTQGTPDTATASTSGIQIYRGDGVSVASLIFDDADDTWDFTHNVKIAGDLDVDGTISGSIEEARTVRITVKNTESVTLAKGTVVHVHPSATPPSGNVVEVKKADYDTASLMPAIGILNEALTAGSEGKATMFGYLAGIDTSSFSAGDELYVGNDGALTNTKPTGASQLIQKIAVVIKSDASNGSIEIFGAGRSNDVPNLNVTNASVSGNTLTINRANASDVTYSPSFLPLAGGSLSGDLELEATAPGTNDTSNATPNLTFTAKAKQSDGTAVTDSVNVYADYYSIANRFTRLYIDDNVNIQGTLLMNNDILVPNGVNIDIGSNSNRINHIYTNSLTIGTTLTAPNLNVSGSYKMDNTDIINSSRDFLGRFVSSEAPLGAVINLRRDDNSIVADDDLGQLVFYGQRTDGNYHVGGRIKMIADATWDGASNQKSRLEIWTHNTTTDVQRLIVDTDTFDIRNSGLSIAGTERIEIDGDATLKNVTATSFSGDGSGLTNLPATETTSNLQTVTSNGASTTNEVTIKNTVYSEFGSNETDINGLLSGSTFGTWIKGRESGHVVIGLRDNDTADSFAIVSGNGNYTTNDTYDKLVARFFASGNATISGNLTASSFIKSGGASSQFLKADGSVDTNSYAEVNRASVTISKDSYTRVARVEGNNLASTIRMTVHGTTANIVVNCLLDISVNHSEDIIVHSQAGRYTSLDVKIISNNNEDFDIYLQYTGSASAGTSFSAAIEVFPLNNETITFSPTATAYTGKTFTHTATPGKIKWGQSDSDPDLYVNTSRVFHDTYHPNADKWTSPRTVTFSGDITGSFSIDGSSDVSNVDLQVANDSHNHDGRYYTEEQSERITARALGWVPAYGNSSESNVFWNESEQAIELYSATDTSIGAAFRAVRMKAGDKIRFTTMVKGTFANSDGLYLRLYAYHGDMPDGKTHVSNGSGNSSPYVQEDSSGDTSWVENGAITADWVTYERTYTAPADGYVSLVVLNWSGYGASRLYVKQPDIQFEKVNQATSADSAASADNADTLDTKHATDFTLDYVTDNGNSTTNDITVGGATVTSGLGVSGGLTVENVDGGNVGHVQIGTVDNDAGNNYVRGNILIGRDVDQVTWNSVNDEWTFLGGGSSDFSMIVADSGGFRIFVGDAVSTTTTYTNTEFRDAFQALTIGQAGNVNVFRGDLQVDGTTVVDSNRNITGVAGTFTNTVSITKNGIGLDVENSATSGADTGIRIRGARNGQEYSTDNLTSYILFSNYDDNTTPNNYDLAKIGAGMYDAGADTGYFQIQVNDGTSLVKALDIEKNKDATFYGSVTATSLIKDGGTQAQFLKADGSVNTLNVVTNSTASGSGALFYTASTGEFEFTPPYLDDFITDSEVSTLLNGYLPTSGGTLTGLLTTADIDAFGDVDISGNLIVDGTTFVVDATENRIAINTNINTSSRAYIFDSDSDPDTSSQALYIRGTYSGTKSVAADHIKRGIFIDLDSSASGTTTDEHMLFGIQVDARNSGLADAVTGVYSYVESNVTTQSHSYLRGGYFAAASDINNASGNVSEIRGIESAASIQDVGSFNNAYASYNRLEFTSTRNANNGASYGGYFEVEINNPNANSYGTIHGVRSTIDNNEGTVPSVGTSFLFYGDYQGTKPASNSYGIFCYGDKHYLEGQLGIGTTSVGSYALSVSGDANFTGDIGANKLRLVSTSDASATSTAHAFQIGPDSSSNIIMDSNEIMARSNGVVSGLHLNPDGGEVTIHNNTTAGTVTIGGNQVIHAGNIGSQSVNYASGADTVDGLHASSFLRTDTNSWTTGYLGIGTSSNSSGDFSTTQPKFHVKGPDTSGSYHPVARFQAGNDSNDTGAAILINHSNDRGLAIRAGRKDSDRPVAFFDLIDSNGSTTNMITLGEYGTANFYCGIGTTSPAYKLDVNGSTRASSFVTGSGQIVSLYQSSWATGNQNHYVLYNAWKAGTGDYLLVKSSGNQSTNNGAILIGDGNNGRVFFGRHANTSTAIDSATAPLDETYAFIGASDTYFSSSVGIGTNSPDVELEVVGVIRTHDGTDNGKILFRGDRDDVYIQEIDYQLHFGAPSGVHFELDSNNNDGDYFDVKHRGTSRFLINGASGNVGIGTTLPSAKLDVNGDAYINGDLTVNGNQIFLDNSPSRTKLMVWSGSTYGIGMESGYTYGHIANNYVMSFQMSNTDARGFWWGDTAHTNAQGAMSLTTTGKLTVASSINVGVGESETSPSSTYALDVTGTIRATADIIAYSDARVKENVKTIDNALDKVTKLRGVSYNKIGETEEKIGVIAQEIEKVLPQVVAEDDNGMKSVAYGNIVGVLIEAIKEQQKQIDELKARLDGSTN